MKDLQVYKCMTCGFETAEPYKHNNLIDIKSVDGHCRPGDYIEMEAFKN